MCTHLNYIPQGRSAKDKAKAFLGYIRKRPGKNETEMERMLFGHGGALTPEQADEMIRDAAKNTYFWRLIISPDPATEDKDKHLDMWDVTRDAVLWLEERLGQNGIPREIPFIGAEHRYDHTEIKHVHAILLIPRRGMEKTITPEILNEFREALAAKSITRTRAQERALEQEIEQSQTAEQAQTPEQAQTQGIEQSIERYASPQSGGSAMPEISLACPMCGIGPIWLNSRVYECRECGYAIKNGIILRKGRERGSITSLADWRLEWDAFWSKVHAGASLEHLHNARFAKLHEIHHLLKTHPGKPSHILGLDSLYGRPIRVQATKTKPEIGNVLDIGSTRCGKSRREIAQLLSWPGSAVVNDIKGELFKATAGQRALFGKVYVVSPIGRGNQFDPLEGRVSERQLYSSAHHLLYSPTEKDTYWIERGTKMLTQLFLAATRIGLRPLPFVGQLANLGLNEVATRLNAIDPALAHSFLDAQYVPLTDYEKSNSRVDAWTTLSSRLYALLTDDIVQSFNGSDFSAKDLLFSEEPITVYFCWPESELHALTPLIRLIWEALLNDLIATYDLVGGVGCHPILLSLDEAGRTGLQNLPEYSATVNGRGIAISMSAQSFEQFKSLYGENRV